MKTLSESLGNERGQGAVGLVVTILIVLLIVAAPFALHFAQKSHNLLHFEVDKVFPTGTPLVGGEAFATTLAELVEHELDGPTGWRPNDFVLWGPLLWADNNSNRQLGILQVVRESTRVMKDHLTKVSSDQFDESLMRADTAFRNDAFKFMLPSAESRFRDGVRSLRAFVDGLDGPTPHSRPINQRNIELIRLFQTWSDMLGDAHARLYRDSEGFFQTDDDFYLSQGVAHAMHHLVAAVAREYETQFANRPILTTLFREVRVPLGQAALLKPLIVFDGSPDGLLANHRHNLDAYINEARQKMYSIREELEK